MLSASLSTYPPRLGRTIHRQVQTETLPQRTVQQAPLATQQPPVPATRTLRTHRRVQMRQAPLSMSPTVTGAAELTPVAAAPVPREYGQQPGMTVAGIIVIAVITVVTASAMHRQQHSRSSSPDHPSSHHRRHSSPHRRSSTSHHHHSGRSAHHRRSRHCAQRHHRTHHKHHHRSIRSRVGLSPSPTTTTDSCSQFSSDESDGGYQELPPLGFCEVAVGTQWCTLGVL